MKNRFVILSLLFVLTIGCNSQRLKQDNTVNQTTPLSDTALFRVVQQQTFQYFWDGAETTSGLARERFHTDNNYPQNDKDVVTSGGSGFGLMAILTGIERGFISREEG